MPTIPVAGPPGAGVNSPLKFTNGGTVAAEPARSATGILPLGAAIGM
jgi:hypothetical protein